mgnify:CR=1 FL=1
MKSVSAGCIVILVVSTGLYACSHDMEDLDQYIDEIKARPGGRIEPLPEITPYEVFYYVADEQGLRSPFVPDSQVATASSVLYLAQSGWVITPALLMTGSTGVQPVFSRPIVNRRNRIRISTFQRRLCVN